MKKLSYLITSIILLAPQLSQAAPDPLDALKQIGIRAYGTEIPKDPKMMAGEIVQIVMGFVGIVFLILIIYSGFRWMTSGGNEKAIEAAKGTIKNSVIGLLLIIIAYAIASAIMFMLSDAINDAGTGTAAG